MLKKTALNASIGTIVLFFAGSPAVSLAAGALAGYLESNSPRYGAHVGGIAGTVALVLVLVLSLIRNYSWFAVRAVHMSGQRRTRSQTDD